MSVYKKLYDQNKDKYFLKICEELSEFQVSLLHYRDRKITYDELLKEIVDVGIQLEKTIAWCSGFEEEAIHLMLSKLEDMEADVFGKLEKLTERD